MGYTLHCLQSKLQNGLYPLGMLSKSMHRFASNSKNKIKTSDLVSLLVSE